MTSLVQPTGVGRGKAGGGGGGGVGGARRPSEEFSTAPASKHTHLPADGRAV